MKKILMLTAVMILMVTTAFAFVFELEVKSKAEIKQFTEEQLKTAYLDAVIEKRGGETFYNSSAFTPKEYARYKALLAYIIFLREEMIARGIEPPPYEEWLKR